MARARETEPPYFHGSVRSDLGAGTLLVPGGPIKPHLRVEEIFEAVRRERFPDRPSRFESVYVSEDPTQIAEHGTLYRVEIRGNAFRADSGAFTEAVFSSDERMAVLRALEYWKGATSGTRIAEVLVDGIVRVLGPGPERVAVSDPVFGRYWTVMDDWRESLETRTLGGA